LRTNKNTPQFLSQWLFIWLITYARWFEWFTRLISLFGFSTEIILISIISFIAHYHEQGHCAYRPLMYNYYSLCWHFDRPRHYFRHAYRQQVYFI
jgi:hypothetical protein